MIKEIKDKIRRLFNRAQEKGDTQNKKVIVMSHKEFDEFCKSNGWNDKNVANIPNIAFISIIGTKECYIRYIGNIFIIPTI